MNDTSTTPSNECSAIVASKVSHDRRLPILPTYFPNTFVVVENMVYSFTDKLCEKYQGGFWEFYELSNGGFYMAPKDDAVFDVAVPFGNAYEGIMSADALGITVCLFVYCYMAEQHPASNFGDYYWHLRNFAYEHNEVSEIMSAID